MIVLAHIMGMPVEEFALPLIGGGVGAGVFVIAVARGTFASIARQSPRVQFCVWRPRDRR
jgi:hypothetical protein